MAQPQNTLYTFRRCPFAMRGRMGLYAAQIQVELREVLLRDKPAHMLEISPKGTVPVLLNTNGTVIDESLNIMLWALEQNDPLGWLKYKTQAFELIVQIDGPFKHALDRYKYPNRYKDEHAQTPQEDWQLAWRQKGEVFLAELEQLLKTHDGFLHANSPTLADYAIFPFIRQFRMPNPQWFDHNASYPHLKKWLETMVTSEIFTAIMPKLAPYKPDGTPVYLLQKP